MSIEVWNIISGQGFWSTARQCMISKKVAGHKFCLLFLLLFGNGLHLVGIFGVRWRKMGMDWSFCC